MPWPLAGALRLGRTDLLDGRDPKRALMLVTSADPVEKTRTNWGIAEIDLERFGVAVTAIRRRGIRAISPAPEARFEAGDVVVLMGVPDALAAGENRLLQG